MLPMSLFGWQTLLDQEYGYWKDQLILARPGSHGSTLLTHQVTATDSLIPGQMNHFYGMTRFYAPQSFQRWFL